MSTHSPYTCLVDTHKPLAENESRAWNSYQKMSVRLFSQLNRELFRTTGVSLPDYEVLETLSNAPDQLLRAFELGTELQWEKSRLSHHIKRMENRELVERIVCETDGRGLWIGLTEKGKQVFAEASPTYTTQVRQLFLDALDPSHMIALAESAEKVLAGLTGDGELCDS